MGRPPTCLCGECRKCKHRIYMRQWYEDKPGYAAEKQRENRERVREYERMRYHSDPEYRKRKLARMKVVIRVTKGTMQRQPCEVCGAENAQAHHDDYDKPFDVRWLCHEHHVAHHNEMSGAF